MADALIIANNVDEIVKSCNTIGATVESTLQYYQNVPPRVRSLPLDFRLICNSLVSLQELFYSNDNLATALQNQPLMKGQDFHAFQKHTKAEINPAVGLRDWNHCPNCHSADQFLSIYSRIFPYIQQALNAILQDLSLSSNTDVERAISDREIFDIISSIFSDINDYCPHLNLPTSIYAKHAFDHDSVSHDRHEGAFGHVPLTSTKYKNSLASSSQDHGRLDENAACVRRIAHNISIKTANLAKNIASHSKQSPFSNVSPSSQLSSIMSTKTVDEEDGNLISLDDKPHNSTSSHFGPAETSPSFLDDLEGLNWGLASIKTPPLIPSTSGQQQSLDWDNLPDPALPPSQQPFPHPKSQSVYTPVPTPGHTPHISVAYSTSSHYSSTLQPGFSPHTPQTLSSGSPHSISSSQPSLYQSQNKYASISSSPSSNRPTDSNRDTWISLPAPAMGSDARQSRKFSTVQSVATEQIHELEASIPPAHTVSPPPQNVTQRNPSPPESESSSIYEGEPKVLPRVSSLCSTGTGRRRSLEPDRQSSSGSQSYRLSDTPTLPLPDDLTLISSRMTYFNFEKTSATDALIPALDIEQAEKLLENLDKMLDENDQDVQLDWIEDSLKYCRLCEEYDTQRNIIPDHEINLKRTAGVLLKKPTLQRNGRAMFIKARFFEKDATKVKQYLKKAGESKYFEAYYWLGLNHLQAKDKELALQCFNYGTSNGDSACQYILGRAFYEGIIGSLKHSKNESKGKELLYAAIAGPNKCCSEALYYLASLQSAANFESGRRLLGPSKHVIPPDPRQALINYQRATLMGNSDALLALGLAYWPQSKTTLPINKCPGLSMYYLELASLRNNFRADYEIANFLIWGTIGKHKDMYSQRALYHAQRAAKSGEQPKAFALIGKAYEEGAGVDRNYRIALAWYLKGVSAGDDDAQKPYEMLRNRGVNAFKAGAAVPLGGMNRKITATRSVDLDKNSSTNSSNTSGSTRKASGGSGRS